jgi:hypothetical protein
MLHEIKLRAGKTLQNPAGTLATSRYIHLYIAISRNIVAVPAHASDARCDRMPRRVEMQGVVERRRLL